MRRAKKPRKQGPRFTPCGSCTSSGFKVIKRDGRSEAVRCSCWKLWKAGPVLAADYKAIAAGE